MTRLKTSITELKQTVKYSVPALGDAVFAEDVLQPITSLHDVPVPHIPDDSGEYAGSLERGPLPLIAVTRVATPNTGPSLRYKEDFGRTPLSLQLFIMSQPTSFPNGRLHPVPTVTISSTHKFSIIDERLVGILPSLSLPDQTATINLLADFIKEIETNGSDPTYLHAIGMLAPNEVDTDGNKKLHLLDGCSWQMAQFMRYCEPTRIDEADPFIHTSLTQYRRFHLPEEKDVTPMLYLAASYSKQPGREAEAERVFEEVENAPGAWKTKLWARAHMSRMYRCMGKAAKAEEQEEEIACWFAGHPYGISPSDFKATVSDSTYYGENHILNHPAVRKILGNSR
ncbi:hypothetical protein DFS33DRAFT_1270120 [Desarmillaria ectypa]|nr:hypothetical protein DFS33DRAFT_1270120 [Desarmillaria ectypa]